MTDWKKEYEAMRLVAMDQEQGRQRLLDRLDELVRAERETAEMEGTRHWQATYEKLRDEQQLDTERARWQKWFEPATPLHEHLGWILNLQNLQQIVRTVRKLPSTSVTTNEEHVQDALLALQHLMATTTWVAPTPHPDQGWMEDIGGYER